MAVATGDGSVSPATPGSKKAAARPSHPYAPAKEAEAPPLTCLPSMLMPSLSAVWLKATSMPLWNVMVPNWELNWDSSSG